jgi:hypothetical protein
MQQDPPTSSGNANADVWELIQALVLGRVPASQILELAYWSKAPGMLELAHAYFIMPQKSQATLRGFLALVRPQTISAKVDKSGQLILSSPDVTTATPILREVERKKGEADQPD